MAIDTIGPYAVQPIRDFLAGFTPIHKAILDADCATLTYDILNWSFAPGQPPPCPNSVYGSVTIGREQGGAYRIRQQTHIGGEPTVFEADVICNSDDTLKSWTLYTYRADAEGKPVPISELRESWENNNGHVQSGDGAYKYRATRPVFSHWTLPHILLCGKHPLPMAFDLIQDLSLLRPNHKLVSDGSVELSFGSYNTYVQSGEGILPVHYLLDKDRRPQLITFGLIAWALTDIS